MFHFFFSRKTFVFSLYNAHSIYLPDKNNTIIIIGVINAQKHIVVIYTRQTTRISHTYSLHVLR